MFEIAAGGSPSNESADALIVGVGKGRAYDASGVWVVEQLGDWVDAYLDGADFEGKPGQVAVMPGTGTPYGTILMVGLGEDPDAEAVRQAAGTSGRAAMQFPSVATTLASRAGADAVVEGLALGQYRFDRHLSEPKLSKTETVVLLDADDSAMEAAATGAVIARAVMVARDLVNESPKHKPPAEIARIAVEMGEAAGVRVKVWDEERIAEEGLGGLMGVAAGAANPPRLVEMLYEPEDPKAFLAVVGKGIVFDSGGLSLKPANAMEDMKTDMSGAAATIAAVGAIARLGLPIKVLGITPLTENMPGGNAQRPGDVLKARNGKTIEVLNTDAEGRLVLADGLSLAAEAGPDRIVDLATLTGACMVALGDRIAGLFGDEESVAAVRAAAEEAGERVWHLPIPEDYRKKIDSTMADMKNTGPRWGGAINAALLLKEFVGDTPWAHLDIAGPARASETEHYILKGGTGFGVRTVVSLAARMAGA
jgi:leucyl aminopeptidase